MRKFRLHIRLKNIRIAKPKERRLVRSDGTTKFFHAGLGSIFVYLVRFCFNVEESKLPF